MGRASTTMVAATAIDLAVAEAALAASCGSGMDLVPPRGRRRSQENPCMLARRCIDVKQRALRAVWLLVVVGLC